MTKAELLEAYTGMRRIRRLEERAGALRFDGEIKCSVHLCLGHEANAVGSLAALASQDIVLATYRGHHWALACGVPAELLYAEFLGRETGVNRGRTGAGLFSAAEFGFLGENGIVGAGAPIALGTALAARFDGSERVTLVAFGDGAMNQGAVHEAMNFASVFDLAVIFLCENNGYAEYTPTETMFKVEKLTARAPAYGIPGEEVDGADVDAVRVAVARAAERARSGAGPTFLDCRVRRLAGHHTHDPEHYRPEGEAGRWAKHDPLPRVRDKLKEHGESDDSLDQIDEQVEADLEAALERARAAPPADPAELTTHVYG